MTAQGGRLPALVPDIEIAEFDTELVVLVPGERRAVRLEPGHAVVLDSCRRGDDLDRLVDDVATATGSDATAARAWVGQVVQELARLGVVTPAPD